MSARMQLLVYGGLALVVAVISAFGIDARATYGAQTTADEPQYLLTALSLWEDGNLDISDEIEDERYRQFHEVLLPQQTEAMADGSRISPHDPLLPVLIAVPMGIWGWAGAKAALALMAGALAALVAWIAVNRFRVSVGTAVMVSGLFALSPPMAIYATQVYPEIPAALLLLAGFASLLGGLDRRGRLVLVVSVVGLPWLAVKYVPLAAVLAIAGLIRMKRSHRWQMLGVFAFAGVAYLLGHQLIYGGFTAYASGDHFVGGEFTAVGTQVDLWGRSTRLIGLIVDQGFGIGAWQPAYLLLPLAAGWALSRRQFRFNVALSLLGVGWLVATFVALTMHGWWFPGRQLVVVLAVAAVLLAALVDRARVAARSLFAMAGLIGVVAFAFLVVEGVGGQLTWVVDFGSTANPFYRLITHALPDYMTPTAATWILHGFWVLIALALAWAGWRLGSARRLALPPPGTAYETQRERVLT